MQATNAEARIEELLFAGTAVKVPELYATYADTDDRAACVRLHGPSGVRFYVIEYSADHPDEGAHKAFGWIDPGDGDGFWALVDLAALVTTTAGGKWRRAHAFEADAIGVAIVQDMLGLDEPEPRGNDDHRSDPLAALATHIRRTYEDGRAAAGN